MLRVLVAALLSLAGLASAQEPPEQTLQQAVAAHRAGDMDAAIRGYRAYLKARPEAIDARSNLGAALASTGRYSEAISEYREALKLSPGNFPVSLNLALAYYKSDQVAKAAVELAGLHKEQPGNKQVVLLLGDCWLRQGEDAKVIELLTPVEKQDENDLAIAYMLGTALLRNKEMDLGQRILDRILRSGDSAEARLLLGTAKLGALEYPDAIADLRKAAELNPHLPDVYSYLGRAEMETGDMAAARAAFEKELAQNPVDFESNLNLAVLLKEDEDYAGARKLLDRALLVRPGDLRVLYQVGSIELAEGKIEQARATFEGVIKQAPQFVEAHISLAAAYYRLKLKEDGDRERAVVQKLKAERDAKEERGKAE
ncbi:MAG TPA: tetratricopeptide repeat protein [Bryobacteraceae bacterium]|nr:tetratricopeptide repeat protein [Bryobacteraceae bacterium]